MAKMTLRKRIALALLLTLVMPLIFCACRRNEEAALITEYTALMQAVNAAEEGDVILVGDIDFTPASPDVPYSMMYIEIGKSITIKSGKRDGSACFQNGGFLIAGSKIAGEKLVCRFEDIIFDGLADFEGLSHKDYEYPWSEAEQTYTYYAPLKAQQALSFKGNVEAAFSGCVFRNYMHEYGPVIDIRYGDYTDNAYLSDIFPDYSGCRLELSFEDCHFARNTALYDGGAIYMEGNDNVCFRARNCSFTNNRSIIGEFSRGGGAIWTSGTELVLSGCRLEGNIANYVFADSSLPEYDTHKGGAILVEGGDLSMKNCVVTENRASMGGGLSLTNTSAVLEGCFLTGNRAEAYALEVGGSGPRSNMAQGGALYLEGNSNDTVLLTNCELRGNSAVNAYGGIYGYYVPFEDPSFGTYILKMSLCTYEENKVDTVYDYETVGDLLWLSHPGDMFANPHLSMFGCLVCDETFSKDFPRNELPTPENGYNLLAPTAEAEQRGFVIPTEEARRQLGEHFDVSQRKILIGSNYRASLYEEPEESGGPAWVIPVICAVLLAGGGVLLLILIHSRMKESRVTAEEQVAPEAVLVTEKQIVMTRYNDEEIERFLASSQKTQLLTGRELEVLREILHGKKQGEVAYYLGIEVSTVKDHYKKIYGKLCVENKDALFKLVSDALKGR